MSFSWIGEQKQRVEEGKQRGTGLGLERVFRKHRQDHDTQEDGVKVMSVFLR